MSQWACEHCPATIDDTLIENYSADHTQLVCPRCQSVMGVPQGTFEENVVEKIVLADIITEVRPSASTVGAPAPLPLDDAIEAAIERSLTVMGLSRAQLEQKVIDYFVRGSIRKLVAL